MTDIVPVPNWGGVRQLETNEYATGGLNGNMNEQAKSLAGQNMYSRLYAGLPFDPVFTAQVGGFPIGGKAALVNGDIVKSTIPNNTNNPNVDMTGWYNFESSQQLVNTETYSKLNYSIYAQKQTPSEQTAEINTVNASSSFISVPSGNFTLENSGNFYNAKYAYTQNTIFAGGTLYGFNVHNGAKINAGTFNTANGVVFNFLADASKFSIRDTIINNTSTSNATSINLSADNITDGDIIGNNITSNGFGILTNDGGTNIDGIVIAFNNVTSKADPIELNAPNGKVHKNIPVIGNILKANKVDSLHNAGFAVGVAAAKNIPIIGNAIRESRWEAIHIEDRQDTISVVGNVAENCKGDFARVQNGGINGAVGGNPVPIIGNNAKSYSVGLVNSGYYNTWDSAGSVVGNIVVGNRFKSFDYGIRGGNGSTITSTNLIESSAIGILSEGASHVFGDNTLINTPVAVKANTSVLIGRINALTPLTALADTSAITSGLRVNMVDGFTLIGLTASVAAGSSVSIPLFDEPVLMCGRLIVRVRDATTAAHVYASSDILYDGTTITLDKKLSKVTGDMSWSGSNFTSVGGKICINIFSASAKNLRVEVIYRGEYYK